MAIELATAYVSIVPSAKGLQANLARELSPVSAAAAAEGTKAGNALGGNVAKGLNSSIGKLSGLAAGFGVPFAAQLATINSRFDLSAAKGEHFRQTLENVGRTSTIAAGVGLAVIGTSAVHAADQWEIARARLETAVGNVGGAFDAAIPKVSALDDRFVKFGFNTSDTENSLSRLVAATGSASKGIQLMGVAADIARARNIPLVQATDLLSKAALGNYLGLRRLGIASKDQIASFHSLADVTDFLGKKFGGQAAAFADTFAGKMAAVKAQANQLEVTLGSALIPKIESIASGAVGAVQGFEHLNSATGGWLGKVAVATATVPIAVFAVGQLDRAGAALAASFSRAGEVLGVTTTETEAATVANTDLAASATAAAEAEGGLGVGAAAGGAAAAGLGVGILAAAAALVTFQHNAKSGDNPLELPSFIPKHIGPIPLNEFAGAGGSRDANLEKEGAAFVGTQHATAKAAELAGVSLDHAQRAMTVYTLATLKGASAAAATDRVFATTGFPTEALAGFTIGIDASVKGLDAGQKAQLRYSLALQQYQADVAPGAHVSQAQLVADASELGTANRALVGIQGRVTSALNADGTAAKTTGFAFLNLGANIKTAAQALDAISTKAFAPIRASITADQAQTGVQDALDALNNPNAGSSGGGGGQTATAAALEQIQKNLTLRDSERGIAQASQAVTDAQRQLTNAQQDQTTATATLKTAQDNYRTTLQGVAKDSQAAKDATDALAQAQDNKASAQLSVRDAQRNLEKAKNDKALLALDVKDARDKLAADKKGTGGTTTFVQTPTGSKAVTTGGTPVDPETIRRDQIALNDAIIAQSGADDTVKRAELQLKDARLAAKQSTKDAAEAQRVYNGTVNGFPPASREAKAAQDQLTQAQRGAQSAADAVRQAQDQLTTATYQTADANLALLRAQADVDGKLTASTGAQSAGKHLDSLKTRTDNATLAFLALADASEKADLAAGHSFGFSIQQEIGILKTFAEANPLLAHAFDTALTDLQNQFSAYLVQHGGSLTFGGTGGNVRRHATGGSTGTGPSEGMLALVHPYEYVMQAKAVDKYGLHMMELMNAGNLPTFDAGGSAWTARSARSVAGGGDFHWHQEAPIYGVNNFKQAVVEALQEHTNKQGFVRGVRVSG